MQNGEDFESMVQGMVQETTFQSQQAQHQQVFSHLFLLINQSYPQWDIYNDISSFM